MPRSTSRTMSNIRFQRRHYQFIAETIEEYENRSRTSQSTLGQWFAHALRGTNASFDRDRFVDACGSAPAAKPLCLLCQSEQS
jgi:hypothetical protein